jgi:hypothetical protein
MSGFSEGSDSIRKWATTVVLSAILGLAAIAVSDSRTQTRENTGDIRSLQSLASERGVKIAIMELEIRQLDIRTKKLEDEQAADRSQSFRNVRNGSSTNR